jgi:hypothetical protein
MSASTLSEVPREIVARRLSSEGNPTWLGEFVVHDGETLVFVVHAETSGEPQLSATFRREFILE